MRFHIVVLLFLLPLPVLLAGCVHCTASPPLQGYLRHPLPSEGSAPRRALVLSLGGLAAGLGWLAWRGRRAVLSARRAVSLDREDLALLRTARDSLAYLVRRQLTRFKVVSLREFRVKRDI